MKVLTVRPDLSIGNVIKACNKIIDLFKDTDQTLEARSFVICPVYSKMISELSDEDLLKIVDSFIALENQISHIINTHMVSEVDNRKIKPQIINSTNQH